MAKPLALTSGEPAGIGPDIAIAAWLRRSEANLPPFYLLGDRAFFADRARHIGLKADFSEVGVDEAAAAFTKALPVVATGKQATAAPGRPDGSSADAVIASIRQAVGDVTAGRASAVVTNPIAKSVLYRAGFKHPGHTEFLAELASRDGKTPQPVMMLWSPTLAVVPVTIHLPLRDAIGLYSASGNIATAYTKGAELKVSLRLVSLGLRNTLVTTRYQWQQSRVRDPFNGIARRTSGDRGNNYDLTVRQDWVAARASAGFTYKDTGGGTNNNDLPVFTSIEIRPVLEGFVEKKLGRTLVLRLEGQNIGGAREIQTRALYAVNAIDGRVSRRDRYDEYRDTRVALRLRGQF